MLYLTNKVFLVLYRVFSLDNVLRFIISLIIYLHKVTIFLVCMICTELDNGENARYNTKKNFFAGFFPPFYFFDISGAYVISGEKVFLVLYRAFSLDNVLFIKLIPLIN